MTTGDGPHMYEELTPRERDVLALMAKGLTNGEIAGELGISFDTAKTHVAHIIAKTGAASREEAVANWLAHRGLQARARRRLRVLAGLPLLVKAGGIAGLAAGSTAAIVLAVAVSGDAESPATAVEPTGTAQPSATPTTFPTPRPGAPYVFALGDEGNLQDAVEAAEELVGFNIEPVDLSALGLEPRYVIVFPAVPVLGTPPTPKGIRPAITYYEPHYDARAHDAYSGLRLEITYLPGESTTGGQAVRGPGGNPTPIQSVEEIDAGIAGYTVTEVRDTLKGGGYAGYLLSGEGRSFQVTVGRVPVESRISLPTRDELIPVLRALAASPK